MPNTKGHDEDEQEDEDETADKQAVDKTDTSDKSGDSDDDDEDDDYDDDSEDDDNEDGEAAKKGIGASEGVAVLDGDEIQQRLADAVQEGIEKGIEYALPLAVAAVLADDELMGKYRSMIGGRINKAIDAKFASLEEVANRLEKALVSGEALSKSVQETSDADARTTPAVKEISAEVLDKAIGVSGEAAKPEDVDALIKAARAIQIEKGIPLGSLTDILQDRALRSNAQAITALKKEVALHS